MANLTSESKILGIPVSEQSVSLLVLLARRGVYGCSAAEVAGRFVEERLRDFFEAPTFGLPPGPAKEE